ncbi:putative nuclease associated modular domain 3 [Lupinus albus]|uniref:Putative nuclease associated modular domain 3 n=1 Tax=Lupinus albus TaxID=3870 RepID=A0A6A4P2P6_LUPAL|nr:putative nuclease associated modular domain 3 [Lupinus albus]
MFHFNSLMPLTNVVDYTATFCPPTTLQVYPQVVSMVKSATLKLTFVCSSQRVVLPIQDIISVDDEQIYHARECNQLKVGVDSYDESYLNNGNEVVVGFGDSLEYLSGEVLKERTRRMRIGLANKGKVPWNKGRKHTAETRERIRLRTLEALRNPKVRKKMAEHPLPHSDQIKAKISSSLRRVWQERLKSKRSREKLLISWEQSIANAARKGESGQEELDWDSYDNIKQQLELQRLLWAGAKGKETSGAKKFIEAWGESIAKAAKKGGGSEQELNWDSYEKIQKEMFLHYQLQRTAEKAKAKEMAKVEAQKVAQKKAIKKVIFTQRRKDHQDRTKSRGNITSQPHRKVKEGKWGGMEVGQEIKLHSELTKIHMSKNMDSHAAREGYIFNSILSRYKKLDLEFIKSERMPKKVSLADQIQAARDKKGKIH